MAKYSSWYVLAVMRFGSIKRRQLMVSYLASDLGYVGFDEERRNATLLGRTVKNTEQPDEILTAIGKALKKTSEGGQVILRLGSDLCSYSVRRSKRLRIARAFELWGEEPRLINVEIERCADRVVQLALARLKLATKGQPPDQVIRSLEEDKIKTKKNWTCPRCGGSLRLSNMYDGLTGEYRGSSTSCENCGHLHETNYA